MDTENTNNIDIRNSDSEELYQQKMNALLEWEERISKKEAALIEKEFELTAKAGGLIEKRVEVLKKEYEGKLAEISERENKIVFQEIELKQKLIRQEKLEEVFSERLENEISLRYSDLIQEIDLLKDEQNRIIDQANEYKKKLNELTRSMGDNAAKKLMELQKLYDAYSAIGTIKELKDLKKRKNRLEIDEEELEALRNEVSQARRNAQEINNYRLDNEALEKMTNRLWNRINELQQENERKTTVTRESMLTAFRKNPTNQKDRNDISCKRLNEIDWLRRIKEDTDKEGIFYTMRHWAAFHTCLKVSEWSPLTVLAGVSGTGKSEMPKRYAKHGGMNFISVPVKPEWDSPSSLFGYFNTLENKFEATELSRLLYWTNKDPLANNRMLIVLLDEMNLAHPEQYFADLLSKYENIRGDLQRNVVIDLALGAGEADEHLPVGRNVLWVGTMNEDETTKGLSDKVVDRSSLITFPLPDKLYNRAGTENAGEQDMLPFDCWRRWQQTGMESSVDLEDLLREKKEYVSEINQYMSNMGRFAGHRVWQSIYHYIRNHPFVIEESNRGNSGGLEEMAAIAFEDAVAFKLMPKLRGIESGDGQYKQNLEMIRSILAKCAPGLSEDYNDAVSNYTGIFRWQTGKFLMKEIL
ncbi:MAG: hypothetical protein IJI14_14430 [Anaerolineaceae bacterium]|nr:hypothetical protein [Anaerolineaceae bacterium]